MSLWFPRFSYPCTCDFLCLFYPCPCDLLWFPINFPASFYAFLSFSLCITYGFQIISLWFPIVSHHFPCDVLCFPIHVLMSYGFQFGSLWFLMRSCQFPWDFLCVPLDVSQKPANKPSICTLTWQAREITSVPKANQGFEKFPCIHYTILLYMMGSPSIS